MNVYMYLYIIKSITTIKIFHPYVSHASFQPKSWSRDARYYPFSPRASKTISVSRAVSITQDSSMSNDLNSSDVTMPRTGKHNQQLPSFITMAKNELKKQRLLSIIARENNKRMSNIVYDDDNNDDDNDDGNYDNFVSNEINNIDIDASDEVAIAALARRFKGVYFTVLIFAHPFMCMLLSTIITI